MAKQGHKKSKLAGEQYSGRQAREQQGQSKVRGSDEGSQRNGQSDAQIQHDIEQHLTHTPGMEAHGIEVSVNHGDVLLLGTVKQEGSRRKAETIAKSIDAVKSVRNDISVRGG